MISFFFNFHKNQFTISNFVPNLHSSDFAWLQSPLESDRANCLYSLHCTVTSSDFLTLSRIWVQTLKYRFAFLFRKFRATSKRWTSGDELHALDWKSGVQILDLRRSSDSEWWIAIAGVIFEWCRMKRPAIDELSTRRELSTREAKRI